MKGASKIKKVPLQGDQFARGQAILCSTKDPEDKSGLKREQEQREGVKPPCSLYLSIDTRRRIFNCLRVAVYTAV